MAHHSAGVQGFDTGPIELEYLAQTSGFLDQWHGPPLADHKRKFDNRVLANDTPRLNEFWLKSTKPPETWGLACVSTVMNVAFDPNT